jgi:tetratricopeptide (TPR) repeat protein
MVLSTDPPEVLQELSSCDLNRQRCIRASCQADGWIGGDFCYVNIERSFAILIDFEIEQIHAKFVESYLRTYLPEEFSSAIMEIARHAAVTESFRELSRLMTADREEIDEYATSSRLFTGRTRLSGQARLEHLTTMTRLTGQLVLTNEDFSSEFLAYVTKSAVADPDDPADTLLLALQDSIIADEVSSTYTLDRLKLLTTTERLSLRSANAIDVPPALDAAWKLLDKPDLGEVTLDGYLEKVAAEAVEEALRLSKSDRGGLAVAYLAAMEYRLSSDCIPLWIILRSARLMAINDITDEFVQYRGLNMCRLNFVNLYFNGAIPRRFGIMIARLYWHEGRAAFQAGYLNEAAEALEHAYDAYRQFGLANYALRVTEGLAMTLARVGAEEDALQAIDRLAGDFPQETSVVLTLIRLRLLVSQELVNNRTWQMVRVNIADEDDGDEHGRASVQALRRPLNEIIFTEVAKEVSSMPAGPVFTQTMYRGQILNISFTGDEVALAHRESYLRMTARGETVAAHQIVHSFMSYIASTLDFDIEPFVEWSKVESFAGTSTQPEVISFDQGELREGDTRWRHGDQEGARDSWRSHVNYCDSVRNNLPIEVTNEILLIQVLQSKGLALEKIGDFKDAIACYDSALSLAERERSVSRTVERRIHLQELMAASSFRKVRALVGRSALDPVAKRPYGIAVAVEAGRSRLFKESVGIGPGPAQATMLQAALKNAAPRPVWFILLPSTPGCIEGWYILAPGLGAELFELTGTMDSVLEAVRDLKRLGSAPDESLDPSARRRILDRAARLLFPDDFVAAASHEEALVISAELYLLDAPLPGLWKYRCERAGFTSIAVATPSIAACRVETAVDSVGVEPTVVADPGGEFGISPSDLGYGIASGQGFARIDQGSFSALWFAADSLVFLGHHALDETRPQPRVRTAGMLALADGLLDVDNLLMEGRAPGTVVLISCRAGQQHTGILAEAREPAGTAIALLKSGANAVIANPNPVRVDVGVDFTRNYLRAADSRHPAFACEAARQAIWNSYGHISDQGLGALTFTCMTNVLWPRQPEGSTNA